MGEFLFEYGLFTAKTITILLSVLAVLIAILVILANKSKIKESLKETIEIEKLNEKYEDIKESLEHEIYTKEEYKALCKEKRKKEKKEQKSRKSKIKKGEYKDETERLYVIKFDGDLHATEVNTLRELISAILQIATQKDEILVVLDSCGGVVHNYGLAASQLKRIIDKKINLTVAVDLAAASGGYMMACVANKIIAAPFAVVGSIGVLAQIPNFNKLLHKHDIEIEQHTAGEYKTTITTLGKVTDKDRKKFKEELEETHELFKEFVKTNRDQLDMDKIATGEYWYGTKALELKLIDEIKTSDDYILEACEHKDVFEVSYKITESLKEKISSMIEGSIVKSFNSIWNKLQQKRFF